jgi:hypothetical protein
MSLFTICQWLQETPPGRMVREGYWGYGIPQIAHLAGMALFGGTVIVDDLRLLGRFRGIEFSELSSQLIPVKWVGFVVTFVSGTLIFMSDATRFYKNPAFLTKLALFLLIALNALFFRLVVYRDVLLWDKTKPAPAAARVVAALSLLMWAGVILASRIIGFTLSDT